MYKLNPLLLDQGHFFYSKNILYLIFAKHIQIYAILVSKLKMMINCIC